MRLRRRLQGPAEKPEIVCHYFSRSDFSRLADDLAVAVDLIDIHPGNPYVGYRFNAVYTKR
jgi:hypothetical protein